MALDFQTPPFLLLLLLLPLLVYLLSRRERNSTGSLAFPSLGVLRQVPPSWRVRYRWLPRGLRAGCLALLVLAAAGPRLGRTEASKPSQGIDIVLTLDGSYSMRERDFGGESRFQAAKKVAREFIAGRENDRLGLVVFAGENVVLSPLTLHYQALDQLLEPVEAGQLAGGTAIGTAVATSLNLLRESRAKSKVIVLLSDGENNAGEVNPQQAAQMAKVLGIKLYTIGALGSSQGRPGDQGGQGPLGRRALPRGAPLDEATLRQMAETSGAAYYRATDEDSLRRIYEEIERLEKSPLGERPFSDVEDLGLYLLLPALLLLGGELVLGIGIMRRVV